MLVGGGDQTETRGEVAWCSPFLLNRAAMLRALVKNTHIVCWIFFSLSMADVAHWVLEFSLQLCRKKIVPVRLNQTSRGKRQ